MMKKIMQAKYIVPFVLLIIMGKLFFISPIVGVADNGDFERAIKPAGIYYLEQSREDRFFDYLNLKYDMKPVLIWGRGRYVSTQVILIRTARILNEIFYSNKVFDLRFLAFVYMLLLLAGVYFLLHNLKIKNTYLEFILGIIVIVVFGDATRIAYFNSFYGEATSYTALLLMIAFAIPLIRSQTPKKTDLVLFFIFSLIFFGAKLQYTLLSVLLLLFIIPIYKANKDKEWKNLTITLSLVTILISFAIYAIAPKQLGYDTMYHSVFYGILKDSKTPEKDLKELGLNERYARLAGTTAYTTDDVIDVKGQEFKEGFYDKMSREKVGLFYITHPQRFAQKLQFTASKSFDVIQGMMGNFQKIDSNNQRRINHNFTFYNQITSKLFPKNALVIILYYTFYLLFLLYKLIKGSKLMRKAASFMIIIISIGFIQFFLPLIGNGEADTAKQLFIFNIITDISLVALVYYCAISFQKRFSYAK
jgi:hypothetical protein